MKKIPATDIIESILKQMKLVRAPKKSLRVVHYERTACQSLGLEGLNRAFQVKLAGGHRFNLGVVESEAEREKLLKVCKKRDEFIPLIVETGVERESTLKDTLIMLFRNAIKHTKRMFRKCLDVRPKHRLHVSVRIA